MELSVVVAGRPERPAEEDLHTASLADRFGYRELWIGEGFVWDAFALATAIGLATDQIAMTVGPIPVTVRDPTTIARATASLATLVRRPVGVALGTSSVRVVERMHGRSRRRAVTALAESARAVRTMIDGERADLDGEILSAHYALRLAAPSAPPGGAVTVAAFGDRAIAVAAEQADRMVLDLVSPELAREYRAKLDALAEGAGRRAPRLAAWIPAAVDPEPESRAQIMESLVGYLAVAGYDEMFTAAGFGKAVEMAHAAAGDPAGERTLAALAAAGAR